MEELKEETKKWTLASDAKLFSYLQKLSSDMNSKTKTFVSKVEDLTFDVAESEVSLRNTFNEFLMLGNTQFIENVRNICNVLEQYNKISSILKCLQFL